MSSIPFFVMLHPSHTVTALLIKQSPELHEAAALRRTKLLSFSASRQLRPSASASTSASLPVWWPHLGSLNRSVGSAAAHLAAHVHLACMPPAARVCKRNAKGDLASASVSPSQSFGTGSTCSLYTEYHHLVHQSARPAECGPIRA